MKVAGIYLAAVAPEQDGRQVAEPSPEAGAAAMEELGRCGLEPLVAVVRADDSRRWLPQSSGERSWRPATCLTAHLDVSFSLRCGLNAVLSAQPDAVFVAPADSPALSAALAQRLLAALRERPGLDYAACGGHGAAMPPVVFAKSLFAVLQSMHGDGGVNAILASTAYNGVVVEATG
ncbi:NTP transferase domain-containing protein [Paenibacillus athensensis]|nr:NTP transferase domain-containing protein [Paenibacillus athensensis]MCD1258328.1 NTP transferase domain-containing protein [Paenibacillus athensensis]